LLGSRAADAARISPIEPLMEFVHETDPFAYFARNRELGFLANALGAGCSVYSRAFTPREAWNAAVGICNLGLETMLVRHGDAQLPTNLTSTLPQTFLVDHDVVSVFEAGWRRLHQDVGMFVSRKLIATLGELQNVDSGIERDLYLLRRELERNHEAGRPWLAQDALEVIAILDTPAWACLCGLLSECPVLPAALTAILDNRGGSFDATGFEPFTTHNQIRKVHEFATRLPDILFH
jgi:hypothetical protein